MGCSVCGVNGDGVCVRWSMGGCMCVRVCPCVRAHMCMGGMAMDPLPPDPYDDHHIPRKRLPPELCQNSGSTLLLWCCADPGLKGPGPCVQDQIAFGSGTESICVCASVTVCMSTFESKTKSHLGPGSNRSLIRDPIAFRSGTSVCVRV